MHVQKKNVRMKGGFIMSTYIHQSSIAPGRSVVFIAIVALHAAAISALMAWRISESAAPVHNNLVWLDRQEPERWNIHQTGPTNPDLVRFAVPIPRNPEHLPLDPEPIQANPPTAVDAGPGSMDPGLPIAPVVEDTPLRYQAVRPSDDYYPPHALRMQQEGVVIVRACVDASGRLEGAPRVVSGSRHRLLDTAAVTWASEALRFTPATRAGSAIAACKDFRVNFTLN